MSRTSFRGGNAPRRSERLSPHARRVWREPRSCRSESPGSTAPMGQPGTIPHGSAAAPDTRGYARRRSFVRDTVTRRVAERPQGFWSLVYATRTLDPMMLRKALERWTREGLLDAEAL
jgi:hypothetical protein